MCRTQHAIAVELFDEDRVLESHDDCARDTDGAERLVSLVEQQNTAIECDYSAPPFFGHVEIGARGETRTHEYRICNPAPWPLGDARKLERKERFELSNRVWKTRMFPATSLPRAARIKVTRALVVG